jgi:hypothetical protein
LAKDVNRSSGVALSETSELAASLSRFSLGFGRFAILSDQLRIGQPPEGLLVEIGVEVSLIDADIGSFQHTLEQTPIIFGAVYVDSVA